MIGRTDTDGSPWARIHVVVFLYIFHILHFFYTFIRVCMEKAGCLFAVHAKLVAWVFCVGLRGFEWVVAWVFCLGLRGSKKSRGESLERISKILK